MDKKITSYSTIEFATLVRKAVKQEKKHQPKEVTLMLLKNFAYNYRAHGNMPEDLQGYILN